MIQHGDDRNVRPMTLAMTPRGLAMQQRLFGSHVDRFGSLSDAKMFGVLRDLRAASELRAFRVWLVGSRVEPGRPSSDIDIVLSPGAGRAPSDREITDTLWHCREYGLFGATSACVIDPCFRRGGPTTALTPLRPRATITTIKLLSPRLASLVTQGRILKCWRVGDVGIEFVRRAEDTDYYRKLPSGLFGGFPSPYLRPAIEIQIAESTHINYRGA
jgi:hypothetical protein